MSLAFIVVENGYTDTFGMPEGTVIVEAIVPVRKIGVAESMYVGTEYVFEKFEKELDRYPNYDTHDVTIQVFFLDGGRNLKVRLIEAPRVDAEE